MIHHDEGVAPPAAAAGAGIRAEGVYHPLPQQVEPEFERREYHPPETLWDIHAIL